MKIVIYSKDNCPNCLKVKNILNKFNPKIISLEKDISREEFINIFPNTKTLPQVVIDNKHIGGYNDVERWLSFNDTNEDF